MDPEVTPPTYADIRENSCELVDHSPLGLCLVGPTGRVIRTNDLALKYLRLLQAEPSDRMIQTILGRPIQDYCSESGVSEFVEVESSAPKRAFELCVTPRSVARGWALAIRETTPQAERRALAEQRDRQATIGQLAAGIAHDFNNLLTVITGTVQILGMREEISEEAKEDLETVYDQGQRAAKLIRQILDFTRQTRTERSVSDLTPFIKESMKTLRRIVPENIEISTDLDVGPLCAMVDLTQIQQILTNLTVNARDAMPDGGKLSVRLARRNPQLVRIEVEDTGMGIPEDDLTRIYDPFFTTKAPGSGTGLGLSQVKGLVEQHGGTISAISRPGRTIFTVELPEVPEVEPDEVPPTMSDGIGGGGRTILVVEDDLKLRALLARYLRQLGYVALEAGDGRAALSTLRDREEDIDLILSDVVMPVMGGLALVEALGETEYAPPIVLMSGYFPTAVQESPLLASVDAYLEKPIKLDVLGATLRDTLSATKLNFATG